MRTFRSRRAVNTVGMVEVLGSARSKDGSCFSKWARVGQGDGFARLVATPVLALALVGLAGSGAMGCRTTGVKPPVVAVPDDSTEARQAGGVLVVSGEVLGVDRVPVGVQNQLTVRVQLQPTGKTPLTVHFGPGWLLDERGLIFVPSEQIRVRGSRALVEGQPVLNAFELDKDGQTFQPKQRK